jgi:hypothetical protein
LTRFISSAFRQSRFIRLKAELQTLKTQKHQPLDS